MGVLDKIKNALFEVEYVEVEEPVKKEKKPKEKVKSIENKEKPIAKKIVLPGKKEEKIEELEEEDLKDEDFEIRPKNETRKENSHEEFKFMDDNDFKMDDEEYAHEEPEIVKVIDNDDEYHDRKASRTEKKSHREYVETEKNDEIDHSDTLYSNKSFNKSYSSSRDSKPYGMDSSFNFPVHEYGTYDKKDERTYFKPSPIISPIYGILDKNYKKEDVVQKKEIRLTTNYTRSNVSVDDIRNKAYGKKEEDKNEFSPRTFEIEDDDDDDDDLLVDLSDDKGKPEVKELTMGDALEYFQDLGLEYNVDYVDASKERTTPRRARDNYDDFLEEKESEDTPDNTKRVDEEKSKEVEKKVETTSVVEIKDESKNEDTDVSLDDDDNLFDLIDSMYQESE